MDMDQERQQDAGDSRVDLKQDVLPYLRALRLARADLLSGQIRGERSPSPVDDAVDSLLDRYFAREEADRGGMIRL